MKTLSLLVIVTMTLGLPLTGSADVELWYASRSREARTNWLIGDDQCAPGELCNPCAADVVGQLTGNWSKASSSWSFNWSTNYPPHAGGVEPNDAFDDQKPNHVQGFTAVGNGTFAMTHSGEEGENGHLAIIRGEAQLELTEIFRTIDDHPGPPTPFGRLVGVPITPNTGDSYLRIWDLDRLGESHFITHTMDTGPNGETNRGGIGTGLVSLFGGGYLYVATDKVNGNHFVTFYHLEGDLDRDGGLHRAYFIGQADLFTTTSPEDTQSLSVITECDTRDIYAVHTGGDLLGGYGSFRLSKVIWGPDGPALEPIARRLVEQSNSSCHLRSGASASTDRDGVIRFDCHERVERGFGSDAFQFRTFGIDACSDAWSTDCTVPFAPLTAW